MATIKKLSQSWCTQKGDKLELSFKYCREYDEISYLKLRAVSKSGVSVDITDLFEENKDLYGILDTMIDNIIKAQ